ncbi:MAG: GNAT family N-acetyltransferase [Rhodobacterales bacterium]|nr:MAG: GNAT family N-acetyltransferase [Rhodobacterales bacterium]
MTLPTAQTLYDVIDGTWPAAEYIPLGPLTLRRGNGGGQRVSATTARQPVRADEQTVIDDAETAMRDMGQPCLFMIREGQDDLDRILAERGYDIVDPVNLYAAPIADMATDRPPRVSALLAWEPLEIMREIWEQGGIGENRINVMHRAKGPKTGVIGRINDHPAGACFCAIHDGVAMVHALEVLPHQRGQKMGSYAMRELAFWARDKGAQSMATICTRSNTGANALYTSLGMTLVGQYHYRKLKE